MLAILFDNDSGRCLNILSGYTHIAFRGVESPDDELERTFYSARLSFETFPMDQSTVSFIRREGNQDHVYHIDVNKVSFMLL